MIVKIPQQGLKKDSGDQRVQNGDLPMIKVTDVALVAHVLPPLMGGGCFETSSSSLGPGKNLGRTSWPRVVAQW